MAGGLMPGMGPWQRRSLTIPPNSMREWIRLAFWELWMGMIVCVVLGLGLLVISSSPDRIVTDVDLTNCYVPPPVALPCERIVYRGGALNAAFTALIGLTLVIAAAWLLWELWSAVEPKPITDDFLRLLNDSFGRDWRNPFTWPWARAFWAYGFTAVGASLTFGVAVTIWMLVAAANPAKPPTVRIDTSQSFSLQDQ